MDKVIHRNTRIPARALQTFTTFYNNQKGVTIGVFEGERAMTRDNNCVGKFELKGIPPALCGIPQIEISFDIDANGIVDVTARDKKTGTSNQITISKNKLSMDEIIRMMNEAKKYQEDDEIERQRVEIRNCLESYLISVQEQVRNADGNLHLEEIRTISLLYRDTFSWLDGTGPVDLMALQQKLLDVQQMCSPILEKLQCRAQIQQFTSIEFA